MEGEPLAPRRRAAPLRAHGLLLALAFLGCTRSARPAPDQPERFHFKTRDGWTLSIKRFAPPGAPRGRPILLVPGVASNDSSLDLFADRSLSRWLAAQGREVWSLALRGTGESDRADPERGRSPDYGLDTLWKEDVTGAVEFVRARTGQPRLDVIGYSLGAMLLYAFAGEGGQSLGASVAVAGPARMGLGSETFQAFATWATRLVSRETVLSLGALAHLTSPLHSRWKGNPVEVMLFNPENVESARWEAFARRALDEVSGGVVLDALRMGRTGRFTSADGRVDYLARLGHVRSPMMIVAGKADRVAPVPAVKVAYRQLGGPKAWLLLAAEHGFAADYGHADVVLGKRAAEEVWPRWLAFLDQHR